MRLDFADLGDHLGYVLRRAQLAGFEAFHRATAKLDITPPRYTALVIVGANQGLTQSALGQALGTARSGAKTVTDWLVERGLAARRRLNGDARAWGLFLTPAGRRQLAALRRRVRAHDAAFARRLTRAELAQLKRLLRKVAGATSR